MNASYEITLLFACAECDLDDQKTFITFVDVVDARGRLCRACLPSGSEKEA